MRRYPYMVLYACLFALVVLLYSISPASADVGTPFDGNPISNPSVASDGAIYRALDAAEWFWASKGVRPCHGGLIFEYDEVGLAGAAARGAVGACAVWFERGYMRMIRRMMRRRPVTALASLCYVAVHERGHNLGYIHGQAMWDAMAGTERFCRQWGARVMSLTQAALRARYASLMKRTRPQPRVRSHIGLAAIQATGAGKHGGSAKAQRRRDRQNMKRALRAGSEA